MLKATTEHQLVFESSDDNSISQQINALISSEVLSSLVPEFTQLLSDALRDSDITVVFTPGEELPLGRGWFMRDNGCRKIFIPAEYDVKQALNTLLLQLCNAALPAELLDTVDPKFHANRDAYALAMVQMEYQSYVRHAQIYHNLQANIEGIKSLGIRILNVIAKLMEKPSPYPIVESEKKPAEILSFEQVWERDNTLPTDQTITHAENFRIQFDVYSIKKVFDDHPGAKEFCKSFGSFLRKVVKQNEQAECFNSTNPSFDFQSS